MVDFKITKLFLIYPYTQFQIWYGSCEIELQIIIVFMSLLFHTGSTWFSRWGPAFIFILLPRSSLVNYINSSTQSGILSYCHWMNKRQSCPSWNWTQNVRMVKMLSIFCRITILPAHYHIKPKYSTWFMFKLTRSGLTHIPYNVIVKLSTNFIGILKLWDNAYFIQNKKNKWTLNLTGKC